MRHFLGVVTLVLVSACASAKDEPPKPAKAADVVSGGARLRGGKLRLDVQVGRPVVQPAIKGSTIRAKSGAAVAP